MQFLLLLSALLSAVTGAFAGPRVVAAQVSQSEAQVAPATPAAGAEKQAEQLLDPCPNRAERSARAPATAPAPITAPPLTSICLIE